MNLYSKEYALAKELGISPRHVCIVGSTLICGKGSDTDYLCLLPSESILDDRGFLPDVEDHYESPLRSFRREEQNLIATTDPIFFFAEVAIAHGARQIAAGSFDMTQRYERIRFHSAVREQVLARMSEEQF